MQSVSKNYLVVAPLPIVVEDGGIAVSYQPGATFTAKNTNPSVVRLLGDMQIIETSGPPATGTTVIEGPQGEVGPVGPQGVIGPAGGLLNALVIDPTTGGIDIEMTDADNIIGQSDGGWSIGSPNGGSTLLRPDTIRVKTSIIVGDTITITSGAITASAALQVVSGADNDLLLTGEDATTSSNNDGGAVVITAGAKDGIGADGKIEFRGNFTNSLVMDVDGAVNLYNAGGDQTVQMLADLGALRVGRNTTLTAAEGDAVFGNDGTLTGAQTGVLRWDASVSALDVFTSTGLNMLNLGGTSNELAVYGATGIRGLKVTVNGGTAEFRAEDAAVRAGVDSVLAVLIRGGNADGIENGGVLALEGGLALGSGLPGDLTFKARGSNVVPLNEIGAINLSTTATSLVGAINEVALPVEDESRIIGNQVFR